MNALRNLWSRPFCLLRQSGQNALLNFNTTAVPLNEANTNKNNNEQTKVKASSFLPSDFKFLGKPLQNLSPGQISPTTLQKCRRLERKVDIVYRCKLCNTRNIKCISEVAYTSGVVILQCDGCGVDHLIKDNLGWFTNTKGKTFDQVLAEQGNIIKVIKTNQYGELI